MQLKADILYKALSINYVALKSRFAEPPPPICYALVTPSFLPLPLK